MRAHFIPKNLHNSLNCGLCIFKVHTREENLEIQNFSLLQSLGNQDFFKVSHRRKEMRRIIA